ncbi:MAG: PilZ domain-containing protein [Acidobacteriota bacterium]
MQECNAEDHDRRAYPRYEVSIPIDLQMQRADSSLGSAAGQSIDLSRGGLRAQIGQDLVAGTRCIVIFSHPTGLTPQIKPATVLRSMRTTAGFEVAVEFERLPWIIAEGPRPSLRGIKAVDKSFRLS